MIVSLVRYLAANLVDDPESISVCEQTDNGVNTVKLCVARDDMGKVIGRHGRTARAIRAVVNAAAQRISGTYDVEITEEQTIPQQ